MQHSSGVQGLRSTGASPRQDSLACSPQDTWGGPSWGLPDAGVQRGCQDGVQGQDRAQDQGGVQDRSFEAEHATTGPKWVWRHFTPAPCTNEMSVWKSLPCERVSGKQFREIIPADKGDEYRHEKLRRARMKAVAHDEFRSAIHHYQNLDT